ncbi:hypothetical protein [Bacillus timonensis]|uniref:hypothetical protein n=1 Tax=Bacillus timonensis TaxID=1033734 RepID=UPI000287D248|nr:hypothetical protein [Bacillus timonensis]
MDFNHLPNQDSPISGTDFTILDFWKWGFSNVLTNSLRGIFAEFLVGAAIGSLNETRIEWDAYDLNYKDKKIEVKSAAFIQAWYKGTLSKISFTIGPKKEYDYQTNTYSPEATRHADLYVFCLLHEKNPQIVNPLDTNQWKFYVVPTVELNTYFPHQKTISLSTLKKKFEPKLFSELKAEIDSII